MRYFIGFLITIGLIILLIILLVGGGGGGNKTPTTHQPLSSYANTSAEVSMLVDGPINANQDHIQIRIAATSDHVNYQKLSGYDGHVVDNRNFPNTEASYSAFLYALERAGFTHGDTSKILQNDQGYCSTGNRFIYELNQDGNQIERFWTSDCGKPKSYLGNQTLTLQLFEAQVPGFENIDTGLSL